MPKARILYIFPFPKIGITKAAAETEDYVVPLEMEIIFNRKNIKNSIVYPRNLKYTKFYYFGSTFYY